MLTFLEMYASNYKFSQNGEEGVIREVLRRMSIENGSCVEMGGADGLYCSNTALLIRDHGWNGVFVETSRELWLKCKQNYANNTRVGCICARVDENNINNFVPDDCDLLSLDLDGPDYSIFKALTAKPKIVIIEIDSSFLPGDYTLNADGAPGYSPMLDLALEKGYFLLAHTGNMVLVSNEYRDLFPEIIGDGRTSTNSKLYFNRSWVKA
jgi:hypothetical protein